jgi:hypothetical protein
MRLLILLFFILFLPLLSFADTFVTFEENGKVGLKNQAGLVMIPATYDALGWSNGSFSISGQVTGYKLKGSWGVISVNNQRITPADYYSINPAEGQLIVASKQTASLHISTGCISTEGKIVIPFSYTGVKIHSLRAVAFIRDGNLFKHGLIDLENKVLIPFQYRNIYPIGSLRYAVENFDGKTALFSESGKQITGFTIDSLSQFRNNLAIIYEAGRQGLMDREGQLKSEAKYREIIIEQKSVKVRLPDQWIVLDAQNKLLEQIEADSLVSLGEGRFKIENAGQSRLVNTDFKNINEALYSALTPFQNNLAIFQSGSHYGVLKRNGSIVLPASYQRIVLDEGYILTQEKKIDKTIWALRDTLGYRKTVKAYDAILRREGSIYRVLKNGYWGIINDFGVEIVACVYDSIAEYQGNQLSVKFKGQYGIISTKEEWLAFPQPHRLKLLNQDRYFKKVGNTLFLCSFEGTVLYFTSNPIEVHDHYFIESVSTGGTWTIDFDGRIVSRQLPPTEETETIFPSTEGLRGIKKNGRYGFIDDEGRLRIANRYEDIKPFSEGLAAMKIRNKWGFINRDERILIQPTYDEVTPFKKGYSFIKQNGLFGLLTKEGTLVLPPRYQSIQVQMNGRLLLTSDQLTGLADQYGNVLLHPKYHSLLDLNNGYVIIEQEGKYGLVTLQGISTIPQIYDQLVYDWERNRYLALKKSEWTEITN